MDPAAVEAALANRAANVHTALLERWGAVPHSSRTIEVSEYDYPSTPDEVFRFAAVCFVLDEQSTADVAEPRVLVCRDDAHEALEWEPPGGKAQADEEPAETAVREVHEETGIEASVRDLLATERLRFDYGDAVMPIMQGVFVADRTGGVLDPEPGIDPRWFRPNDLPAATQYRAELLEVLQESDR